MASSFSIRCPNCGSAILGGLIDAGLHWVITCPDCEADLDEEQINAAILDQSADHLTATHRQLLKGSED